MKMFALLSTVISTVIFAGSIASAQSADISATEYFHQPAAGTSEVTPHVGYRTSTSHSKTANSPDYNLSGMDRLGVSYFYGINELFALGADLSYSSFSRNNNGPDNKGIEPLMITAEGRMPMTMGMLNYGLVADIGLEKAKTTASGVNRSFGDEFGSIAAGGFHLAPYVGYTIAAGPGALGAKIQYEVVSSDTKVDVGGAAGETTVGGGNQGNIAVYYEAKLADMPLGAALTYDWFDKVTTTPNGGSTSDLLKSRSLIGVKLYTSLPLGGFDFMPSLAWREKAGSDDFDKLSDLHFNIAGRFTF